MPRKALLTLPISILEEWYKDGGGFISRCKTSRHVEDESSKLSRKSRIPQSGLVYMRSPLDETVDNYKSVEFLALSVTCNTNFCTELESLRTRH